MLQAEVQALHADGSIALHTRSTKYGKVSASAIELLYTEQLQERLGAEVMAGEPTINPWIDFLTLWPSKSQSIRKEERDVYMSI